MTEIHFINRLFCFFGGRFFFFFLWKAILEGVGTHFPAFVFSVFSFYFSKGTRYNALHQTLRVRLYRTDINEYVTSH